MKAVATDAVRGTYLKIDSKKKQNNFEVKKDGFQNSSSAYLSSKIHAFISDFRLRFYDR